MTSSTWPIVFTVGRRDLAQPRLTNKQAGSGGKIPTDRKSAEVADDESSFQRRKGESLKAYLERLDVESNAKIMESYKRDRRMSDRRRRYVLLASVMFCVMSGFGTLKACTLCNVD